VISIPDPVHGLFHLTASLCSHPFILDPISYVDQGSAEVHAASAREVATSAGDSLSNSSAGITGHLLPHSGAAASSSDGLGMVVGIPCMANTDTKINNVFLM
jgi:hypothetical protein